MTMLMHPLLWSVLLLLATGLAVSPEEPPSLAMPDLSSLPAVPVLAIDAGDVITVEQGYLKKQIRLAWLRMSDNPQAQQSGKAFLQNLLAGEKVWLVQTAASINPKDVRWYVYRWPDRLLVNLEIVRQGYADMASEPEGSLATAKVLRYWRDRARQQAKGIWSLAAEMRPVGSQPAEAVHAANSSVADATPAADSSVAPTGAVVVYVSASGKKYHRANCRSLRKGGTPMPLDEARKSRDPCKQCSPPP